MNSSETGALGVRRVRPTADTTGAVRVPTQRPDIQSLATHTGRVAWPAPSPDERGTMVDQLRSTRLTGRRAGLYAPACAARLARVAAAIAWPLARKVFTACTEAAWTGGGRLDPALAAHLERAVRRVLIADSVDEFGAELADLLAAAGHAV